MTPEDVNRYVGLRWVEGGTGPDAYNCWGLLQAVQRDHFGVALPDLILGDAARQTYADNVHAGDWKVAAQPFHGAGVLMRGGSDPHVGIWLDLAGGGVLHSLQGAGVIWSPRPALRLQGFSRMQFYRFNT